MMHGRGKSSPAIVARKPANKAEPRRWLPRRRWSEGQGPRGMRTSKARTGRRTGFVCHRRWNAYGRWEADCSAVYTRGGSRMRESRTYGSVRGACDEKHVPTATYTKPLNA